MKLTYRDKVLLTSLLVVLVWVAGIMLFIKPAFEDMNSASKTYADKNTEYQKKKEQVEKEADLKQKATEAFGEVSKLASNFYDTLSTDEVCEIVDTLLDKDNIENDSLTISAYSTVVLDKFGYTSTVVKTDFDETIESANPGSASDSSSAAPANTEVETAATVPNYTVSFGYKCRFEDLKAFLDKLTTNNEKSLVVTNCTITNVNEDEIEGNMTMNLMMLPRLPDFTLEAADNSSSAAE